MVDQVRSCDPAFDDGVDHCHPYLRTSLKTAPPVAEASYFQNEPPCNSCCAPIEMQKEFERRESNNPHYKPEYYRGKGQEDSNHMHCVAHSCPLGKIVCCSDCNNNDCAVDKGIVKAVELGPQRNQDDDRLEHRGLELDGLRKEEKTYCARKTSWTEPRICRCDLSNPMDTSKRCECECGATIAKGEKRKEKKSVRFDDRVETIDCDEVFQNLRESDVEGLCSCCKGCMVKGEDESVGQRVLVYEVPEPKFEGTSVTHDDFCWQKTPRKKIPPWHPCLKDRWYPMNVPSLAETTYQSDYKHPPVSYGEREPVKEEEFLYSSPPTERRSDPSPKEYPIWEKTSTGPSHVYHSACDTCDRDLHRVHLHECEAAHLPPQYQCHGDGHICQPPYHAEDKFAPCDTGDAENARYWWERSCCDAGQKERSETCDLPQDWRNATCPGYTTGCKRDCGDLKKLESDGMNCSACEYCTGGPKNDPPRVCTQDPSQSLITQRAGII